MNNSLFSKFTPKETKFFPLLKEISDVMIVASDLLIDFVSHYDQATALEKYKKIKEQEKKGDALSTRIFDELNTTFITPFDREDINQLATKMDDVTDYINSCAKRIVLYKPDKLQDSALKMAELIKEGTIFIGKAVDELDVLKKDAKRILIYCQELHDIENKADDVYENFIINLFEVEKSGIEIIKHKEIMQEMEKATDVAEYVGKIIKTIIIKYA